MSIIFDIPATIRVIIPFIGILLAIRMKLSLGNAFMIGVALLCLLFGLAPAKAFDSTLHAAIDAKTLALSAVIALILILSNCLEQSGQMQRMLAAFKGIIVNPRLNLIVFPALIGLLPMPGGAVFSAPMVKNLAEPAGLSSDRLSFINYWFRHIWEYWWPLYPGILLAAALADVSLGTLMIVMCPFSLLALAIGLGQMHHFRPDVDPNQINRKRGGLFIRELFPILIAIVVGLGAGWALSARYPGMSVAKEIGLIFSLTLAIAWTFRANRMSPSSFRKILASPAIYKMVYMIFAILIFKSILEDSGAVEAIGKELLYLKIPLSLITAALPMLVGIITGITVAVVGAAFPILVPLVHSMGASEFILLYAMLGLACGFVGVLLSPLHLCLLLSNEYFQAPMKSVYPRLWLPCVIIVAFSGVYFLGWRLLLAA